MKSIARAFLLIAIGLASPAAAQTPVETYAQQTIDKGVALLKGGVTGKAQQDALRDFLKSTLDIRRIALFTLGAAARTAPPADVENYVKAFQDFTLANYVSRIGAYGGQSLKVASTVERAPGDFVVTVEVIDPAQSGPPDTAQFRIMSAPAGGFAVVDASVEGVWFEVAQREDVQGFLAQNGGSIPKLIEHLNQMTAAIAKGSGS
jgi:ABC-type transporter MlaC component